MCTFRLELFSALLLVLAPWMHAQIVNSTDYSSGVAVGVPRGAIFTILGDNGARSTASATLPLPTNLNGVTVRISCGGADYDAPLLFASPLQINAVLPSSVPEGDCVLTVLSRFTLALGFFTVTGGRFAAFTQGSRGYGPAVMQQYDANGQPSLVDLT